MTNDQRTPASLPAQGYRELPQDAEEAKWAAEKEARTDRRERYIRELERQVAEEERQRAVAIGRSLNKHDR